MRLTYKYALRPTNLQVSFLEDQLHSACELYNAALEERIGAWKISHKFINYYDQCKQLKEIRKTGDTRLVNYTCCQDVLQRVDKTFKAFYRRVQSGVKRVGFPRWRSYRRYNSLTFPIYGNGCSLCHNGKLRIQGVGYIRVVLHRPVDGEIKTVTIKRDAGHWFVCFSVIFEPKKLPISIEAVGIDVGLTHFATLSNGSEIENPRYYKQGETLLRRAQRKVSRRKKGSSRRRKAIRLLQRAHSHIRNQRVDFHHKTTHHIVNRYGMIAVEDLNISGLTRCRLAKAIQDAGWSAFINSLTYKAEKADRVLIKVDPHGTSQTCTCGSSVPKKLADRWHNCSNCGLSAARDHVSAQVILARAGFPPSGVNVDDRTSCVS